MLNMLFVHLVAKNSQFLPLHRYLLKNKLANSYMLCTQEERQTHQFTIPNLLSFQPDGNISDLNYYYSGWAEQGAKVSIGVFRAVQKLRKTLPIDVIIYYHTLGAAHLLINEIDTPVISYLEFPSFQQYGYDPQYPPVEMQRLNDTGMEMLSYYQIIRSARTIVPTKAVRDTLPECLREKVIVQMDGFDPERLHAKGDTPIINKQSDRFYIGFSARVLCAQKGYEQFIKVSQRLLALDQSLHFVVTGMPTGETYGYESHYTNGATFKDYINNKYGIDQRHYTFIDQLSYEDYSTYVHEIDLFLYPLFNGSNNWGFFELFTRGKIVIGSERSFLPDVIRDGENGFICSYDDIDAWVSRVMEIRGSYPKYQYIQDKAREDGKHFYLENVAPKYLDIVRSVL
ncbi:MAG: glycosyltransferase [Candidatus Margulisiibacteriota bacterium]|jgi:hypothetical protein